MDITDVYYAARKSYDKLVDSEQLRSWKDVLANFTPEEIEAAVREHQGDTSYDDSGEPKGKWFPSTSRIKAICVRRKHSREAVENYDKYCGECQSGFVVERVPNPKQPGKMHNVARRCKTCEQMWGSQRSQA